jgi:cyclopropane-fatty-acyl-phospholipid synthase
MIKKIIVNRFIDSLNTIEFGTLKLITPDNKEYYFGGKKEGINATMTIKDHRAITNLIAKGDIGLTEAYRDNWWDTDNLTDLLKFALQNAGALDQYVYGSKMSNIVCRILYSLRSNTLNGSKRNIHAHYDLGNDFYSLWLDKTMTYSSGLYNTNSEDLQQAQYNKYDRIIDSLEKSSGSLLEIGCGWGGFIERATYRNDYDIKGITISDQQYTYAKKRVEDKANILYQDYRKTEGKYDNIVSIEMFEAVGQKFWPVYFNKIKSLLESKGKAIVQTITIDEMYFDKYIKTGDMIRSFIFPGGMLPSIELFKMEAKKAGLQVVDHYAFGNSYATTLSSWLENFEKNLDQIKLLNFDDRFIRVWRFYLSASIASFTSNRTNVIQAEIKHA